MLNITGMGKDELTKLDPGRVNWSLSSDEIIYIAKVLGACWEYDYRAAEKGKTGLHPQLKSGLHSDGFFSSKILFSYPNIKTIIANQLVRRFNHLGVVKKPDWVAGIPNGATELGREVARIMKARATEMKKEDGRIMLESLIQPSESVLLVEDFCTRGTGFEEAVREIWRKQPLAEILPIELVVVNRGGLKRIIVHDSEGSAGFDIVAAVNHRMNDWDPRECWLCIMGSHPIKPKATDKNWQLLITSQM